MRSQYLGLDCLSFRPTKLKGGDVVFMVYNITIPKLISSDSPNNSLFGIQNRIFLALLVAEIDSFKVSWNTGIWTSALRVDTPSSSQVHNPNFVTIYFRSQHVEFWSYFGPSDTRSDFSHIYGTFHFILYRSDLWNFIFFTRWWSVIPSHAHSSFSFLSDSVKVFFISVFIFV